MLDLTEELSSVQTEGVDIVRSCLFTLRSIEESTQVSEVSKRPQTVFASHTGVVGQPKYIIPEQNLIFLLENRFTTNS